MLMFKPKLFNKNIEPQCAYCEHGNASQDGNAVLCKHRGIVSNYFSCNKFIYDPLMRIPKKTPDLPVFDKSDFEL